MVAGVSNATAQTAPDPSIYAPPIFASIDSNGFDLIGASINLSGGRLSIGSASAGLSQSYLGVGTIPTNASYGYISTSGSNYLVTIDGTTESFTLSGTLGSGGTFSSQQGRGSSLSYSTASGGTYTYTRSDGTMAKFQANTVQNPVAGVALISSITKPNGELISYVFDVFETMVSTTPGCDGTFSLGCDYTFVNYARL
jgi:hypothetical protein